MAVNNMQMQMEHIIGTTAAPSVVEPEPEIELLPGQIGVVGWPAPQLPTGAARPV